MRPSFTVFPSFPFSTVPVPPSVVRTTRRNARRVFGVRNRSTVSPSGLPWLMLNVPKIAFLFWNRLVTMPLISHRPNSTPTRASATK